MQRLTLTICALVLVLDSTPGQAQEAKGLSTTDAVLILSAKESSVKSGTPIWVDITVENKSDHGLMVYRERTDDQGGWVYSVDVQDDEGRKPQPTKFVVRVMPRPS